jgi:hypothetical protein
VSPTAALSRDVAAALAERLDEIAPEGVTVRATGTRVQVVVGGRVVGWSSAAAILDEDGEGLPEERVGSVAAAVISGVQDEITEALTEPWPTANGRMLNPDTSQTGGAVRMWFGDENDPGLTLRPLTIPGWA